MALEPKPSRGMPRSLLYALIPGGFILMVVLMMVFGRAEQEEAGPPGQVETTAPATGTAAERAAQPSQ
ncbi:hypothetical protein [Paracoccus niistensis]|uniref:Uncharacterized protein n=1 Tax=Paracoccus niistensis TaxID=632935 RepID=A0ABV6I4I8_9RHOB